MPRIASLRQELLLKAAEINNLDLGASFFVGDRLSDIECGLNAGCRTVLLTHLNSSRHATPDAEDVFGPGKGPLYCTENLIQATQWILEVSSDIPIPKTHELE